MEQRNKIDLLSMSSKRFETELKMKIDEMNITESYLQKIVDTKLELSQENERLNSEIHELQVEKDNNLLKIKELNYVIDDRELKIKILEDLKVIIIYIYILYILLIYYFI